MHTLRCFRALRKIAADIPIRGAGAASPAELPTQQDVRAKEGMNYYRMPDGRVVGSSSNLPVPKGGTPISADEYENHFLENPQQAQQRRLQEQADELGYTPAADGKYYSRDGSQVMNPDGTTSKTNNGFVRNQQTGQFHVKDRSVYKVRTDLGEANPNDFPYMRLGESKEDHHKRVAAWKAGVKKYQDRIAGVNSKSPEPISPAVPSLEEQERAQVAHKENAKRVAAEAAQKRAQMDPLQKKVYTAEKYFEMVGDKENLARVRWAKQALTNKNVYAYDDRMRYLRGQGKYGLKDYSEHYKVTQARPGQTVRMDSNGATMIGAGPTGKLQLTPKNVEDEVARRQAQQKLSALNAQFAVAGDRDEKNINSTPAPGTSSNPPKIVPIERGEPNNTPVIPTPAATPPMPPTDAYNSPGPSSVKDTLPPPPAKMNPALRNLIESTTTGYFNKLQNYGKWRYNNMRQNVGYQLNPWLQQLYRQFLGR